MSIGIILTLSFDDEVVKGELISVDIKKRPWLQNIDPDHIIDHEGEKWVSDDVSIGYYIKNSLNIPVNFIMLDSINVEQEIQKNIVNFLIIYDLLEAFHTLPEYSFKKIKYLLQQPNVYPPFEYQHFVNHKNVYYEYLRSKGIPVLPFVYVSQEEFHKNKNNALDRIMKMEKGDFGKVICKPIYGQEGKDIVRFNSTVKRFRIEAELEQMFHLYKGVVFQPYISSFADSNEFKIMFVGNSTIYGVFMKRNNGYRVTYVTEKERPDVFRFAREVFHKLPKLQLNGISIPRLITRIDIGCCYGESKGFFVSEVEFVPSLFTDIPEINDLLIDVLVAKQAVLIFEKYKQIMEKNKLLVVNNKYNMYGNVLIIVLISITLLLVLLKFFERFKI